MLVAVLAVLSGSGLIAQGRPSTRVPEGNGRPILIDGIFTPGEWDDALKVEVGSGRQLLLKRAAGFVFVGIRYTRFGAHGFHGSVDLYISPDGKAIHQLHVSAQLGERLLNSTPGLEDDPPFDWGDTSGWYANEGRWSQRKVEALVKEGWSRQEAQLMSMYRSEGHEFQIRQSKFGTDEWFLRLRTNNPPDFTPEFWPMGSDPVSTAGWLKLMLK
jgi:hypothetical protein